VLSVRSHRHGLKEVLGTYETVVLVLEIIETLKVLICRAMLAVVDVAACARNRRRKVPPSAFVLI
jgi:hypothetical protein